MAERAVKIGLVGFGTVGSGVAKLILEKADSMAAKMGLRLNLAAWLISTHVRNGR